MAKSKSFFGLRRGSTKSHTYSVFNGQQVTKDRVDTVKNPRSEAQMIQRMVMNTVGAAYSSMKEIVDHSFEGKTYGLNSMMYFSSKNANAVRASVDVEEPNFAFTMYKYRGLMKGKWLISEGTLASTLIKGAADHASASQTIVTFGTLTDSTITADALMAQVGAIAGDMATVCFARGFETWGQQEFGFVRFKFLKGGTEALTAGNLSQYVEIESNLPISVALGNAAAAAVFSITVTSAVGGLDTVDAPMICTIHSRQADGKWLRSTENFAVPANADYYPSWYEALSTYPIGQSYVLNGATIE